MLVRDVTVLLKARKKGGKDGKTRWTPDIERYDFSRSSAGMEKPSCSAVVERYTSSNPAGAGSVGSRLTSDE